MTKVHQKTSRNWSIFWTSHHFPTSPWHWALGPRLHALELSLQHPSTAQQLTFRAPVPEDMRQLIRRSLESHGKLSGKWSWKLMEIDGNWWKMMENGGTWWKNGGKWWNIIEKTPPIWTWKLRETWLWCGLFGYFLMGDASFRQWISSFRDLEKKVYERKKMAETFNYNQYKWKSLSNAYNKYVCAYTGTCLSCVGVCIRPWRSGPDGKYLVGVFVHPRKLINNPWDKVAPTQTQLDHSESAPKAAKGWRFSHQLTPKTWWLIMISPFSPWMTTCCLRHLFGNSSGDPISCGFLGSCCPFCSLGMQPEVGESLDEFLS